MSAEPTPGATDNSDQVTRVLDLRMPGDRAMLASTTDIISDKLAQLHVPEEKQLEIILAVQEALANAVVHGCKNDASKEVRCQMELHSNGRILIVITDPGPGFVTGHLNNPTDAGNLYADHGRGVYMIHELMDEVSFENNGSEIRMWKY